jgi:uncharacterized membrane protein YdjX (TVP38/TMEM64 family)
VKKVNPIYLLVAFNLLYFLFANLIGGGEPWQAWVGQARVAVADLGAVGYVTVIAAYVVCAFFFIPLLIPLNVAAGALYGPYVGTAVSLAGITAGTYASTVSVRRVFTGMQSAIEKRSAARKLLGQAGAHGAVAVLIVRLAFVVPYLIQNIVLASAPINSHRLALLTAVGALPGAAVYCFLGAGLVQQGDVSAFAAYLAVPLLLLIAVSLILKYLNAKYRSD